MSQSSTTSDFETTIGRIRLEVGKRKGVALPNGPADRDPSPSPKEKNTPFQKISRALGLAQSKQDKARKWPKLFRSLRRNQETINQQVIDSAAILTQEVDRLEKLVLSLVTQQMNLLVQQQTHTRRHQGLAERMTALEETVPTEPDQHALEIASAPGKPQMDAFYWAFEERFCGTRSQIKEQLLAYRPFLRALKERIPEPEALDVGCGRGEWLEILTEMGITARGVDLNACMVESCRALGFEAQQGDALAWLRGLPDASLAIVSGFHIVECLPIPVLLDLFQESARVLRPGGIAIFETPNPECQLVSGYTFHLDPTRRNPVPHELLSFIGTHTGFSSVQVERCHPFMEEGVLKGYGDYAGIFTK